MTRDEAIEKLIHLAYQFYDIIDETIGEVELEDGTMIDRAPLDEAARAARG